MQQKNGSLTPHLALLAMIAIWGGSYAVAKAAMDALSPFAIVALRFWIALLCLAPFLGRTARVDLAVSAKHGLLAGFVLAIGYLLQFFGMNETSASTGGFLAGLIVLLVAVGGAMWFGTPFGWRAGTGLALGLVGLVMVSWQGEATDGPRDTVRGIVLQIAASTSYAMHILLLTRNGRGKPAIAYCTWQLVVVAVAATITAAIDGRFARNAGEAVAWTPALVAQIAYLGVLATALGIAVQSKVQHRIPSSHAALLFALQPLFAAVIAWAFLGDRMAAPQIAGGATIIVGVILASFERSNDENENAPPSAPRATANEPASAQPAGRR